MKIFNIIIILSFVAFNINAQDTLTINTHNKVVIKTDPSAGSTSYAAWGEFPKNEVSFRKVLLTLEMGCAPGLKCGEWDYLNHIYIGKKGGVAGDSLHYELGRFITPYGFYWTSAQNWKHAWVFDITDFAALLHDSVEIIYKHTGYEANNDRGWTINLDFRFIKGTPALLPMGVQEFHQLNAPYGDSNTPFKTVVPDIEFKMPSGSDFVTFKTTQSGHGMDNTENCSEFCSKKRTLLLDNNSISEKNVWRNDCGLNPLYPQAGTWLYDRAGWCPGSIVIPDNVNASIKDSNKHTFSFNMENYVSGNNSANYSISTYAFYTKNNQKELDVDLESILAPSTEFQSLRYNPTCGAPIIKVKNMGKQTVTGLDFEYGKVGGVIQKIWVPCEIKPLESQILNLEAVYNWQGASDQFFVNITKVNGKEDEFRNDNIAYSKITNSDVLPNAIVIEFKSNNAPTENYYTLKDAKGKVLRNKTDFLANTLYKDTIYLDNNICYTLSFFDDGPGPSSNPLNKDGLYWWANTSDGTGFLRIRNLAAGGIAKNFQADFGTSIVYNFSTSFRMDIKDIENNISMDIFPNPAKKSFEIDLNLPTENTFQLEIVNSLGQIVKTIDSVYDGTSINIEGLSQGIYFIKINSGNQQALKKVIIEK